MRDSCDFNETEVSLLSHAAVRVGALILTFNLGSYVHVSALSDLVLQPRTRSALSDLAWAATSP